MWGMCYCLRLKHVDCCCFIIKTVPVSEGQLPVELPIDVKLTGRGPSLLAQAKEWQKSSCGKYGL